MLARHARAVSEHYHVLAGGVIISGLTVALRVFGLEFPTWVNYAGIVGGVIVAQYLAWRAQVLKGIESYEPDVGSGLKLSKEWPVMQHHDGRLPHGFVAEIEIITAPSELLALRVVCSAPILAAYCTAALQPHTEEAGVTVPRQDTARFSFPTLLPVGTELYLSVSSSQPIHLMEISLVPLKT
jgi:hypothetical protein